MDKENKTRSGSQNNDGSKQNTSSGGGKSDMKGAPLKSNRQTGDHEKDDSSHGPDKNTTKKQANSI